MAAPSGIKWGSIVNGSSSGRKGRLGIYVNVSSTTSTTTVHTEIWFWTIYSCTDDNHTLYYDAGKGVTAASTSRTSSDIKHTVASGDGWSTSNQTKLYSTDKTYDRSTSAVTHNAYAKLSGIEILDGTPQVNTSYTIPALPSYTVKYNANGGSGAPATQTMFVGKPLTISSTKPTRTGYAFQGWSTTATGDVKYSPGGSYTFTTSGSTLTLYAVWKANTYTVKYDANGGSGAPSNQTKTHGKTLTLSSTKPTRTNYTFKGWGTSKSSTTVAYAAGASYTTNAAITLYAIWTLSYKKPRINNFSVKRCNDDGTLSDTGTYALVKFDWECDKSVTNVAIEWKLSSSTSWTNGAASSASGTSGSVSHVIGSGALSTEHTYDIRVTVADGSGDTYASTKSGTLEGTQFLIDLKSDGNGIAFGKPAEVSGYMDVGYKSRFRDNMVLDNAKSIYGYTTDGATRSMLYMSGSNNTVLGYGGYSYSFGATAIYGNEVNLYSRGAVNVKGCRIAENKVLWSGGYYMSDTQTATLSEAISAQANGIVLVWSWYEDGEFDNSAFNMFFVPKHFVSAHNGKGLAMSLWAATATKFATKYAYISDTTITGHANNNAEPKTTDCGIVSSPKSFVLRYVIGV